MLWTNLTIPLYSSNKVKPCYTLFFSLCFLCLMDIGINRYYSPISCILLKTDIVYFNDQNVMNLLLFIYLSVFLCLVPPLFVIEFLHRVFDTFIDYFSECSEQVINDQIVVVYEVRLDVVMKYILFIFVQY